MAKKRLPHYVYTYFKNNVDKCQNCEKKFAEPVDNGDVDMQYLYNRMEIHHLLPLNKGGTHDKRNLQALCGHCHYEAHCEEFSKGTFFMLRYRKILEKVAMEGP